MIKNPVPDFFRIKKNGGCAVQAGMTIKNKRAASPPGDGSFSFAEETAFFFVTYW